MKQKNVILLCTFCLTALTVFAETATINIQANKPGHAVSPTLWGIFFEDINLSADGGIYPELVRNRSFEDSDKPDDWKITGAEATIDSTKPLNPFNRKSLRLKASGPFTISNDGYWGMNAMKGESYTLKLAARATDGFNSPLTAKLVGADSKQLASGEIAGLGGNWKYHTLT